jgi:undecaprenyl-diphosphatase
MPKRLKLYINQFQYVDSHLCITFNRTSHNILIRNFFKLVSRLGDGVFWYSLMALMLWMDQDRAWLPVCHMALAGLVGTLIYKWLKIRTLRPRPFNVHQQISLRSVPLDQFSFPSGHTLHAVIFSMIAIHYYPMLATALIPLTILIGLSRPILGLHYPSDVLVGGFIGILISTISFYII